MMQFDANNPKASLLSRSDVRGLCRLTAHYSDTCRRFEAEHFEDVIPPEQLKDLRELIYASVNVAMGILVNRSREIVSCWHETIPTPELAHLLEQLSAIRCDVSAPSSFNFFGLGDFATPKTPKGVTQ